MSLNKHLISGLSEKEQREFTSYLTRKNKRADVKNIQLFKSYQSDNINSIKESTTTNAFHALTNRLSSNLIDFTSLQLIENEASEEIKIIKLLLVARKLLANNHYKSGFRILVKAEKKAISIEHFTLLQEIYATWIEHSHNPSSKDQTELFEASDNNQLNLQSEEKLNRSYAIIRKAFNQKEFESKEIDLNKLITNSFDSIGVDKLDAYNYKSLLKIAKIIDFSAAASKNYHSVDLFFVEKMKVLKNGPLDSLKYLQDHIDLLFFISNIYFRKKEFTKSLEFLNEMQEQMKRFDHKYYQSRRLHHLGLKALNLNFSGKHKKAAALLDGETLVDSETTQFQNLYLIRIVIHFQQGQFTEAKKLLASFYKNDSWYEKNYGLDWLLNRKYIEILVSIELQETNLIESRISSLTRKHKDYFTHTQEFRILPFLSLVKAYYRDPKIAMSKDFQEKVEASIHWKPQQEEDLFLMSYYAWLKSKMNNQPLYETTLELINNK